MVTVQHINLALETLTPDVLRRVAYNFKGQAASALSGGSSTLSMYPSFLVKASIKPGQDKILVVDLGGSHLRMGVYSYSEETKQAELWPGSESQVVEVEGTEQNMQQYCSYLAVSVKQFLEKHNIEQVDSIGLTFSYPAKIVKGDHQIDASRVDMGEDWGKGFIVRNSEVNITEAVRAEFEKAGIKIPFWVTLNDVVALFLSEPSADLAVVVGTGYNIGLADSTGQIYNSESAFYHDDVIDASISRPAEMYITDLKEKIARFGASKVEALDSRKFSEVQIAGRYLYRLMLNGLLMLGEANVDLIETICSRETECLSRVLKKDFSGMQTHARTQLSLMEMKNMYELAKMLVRRSEDLVAAELAGAAMFSGIESRPFKVATDGSVINLVPDFKTNVQKKLAEILGNEQIELITIEDSGLKGGANAVLSASRTNNKQ